jgi:hypothetical protein
VALPSSSYEPRSPTAGTLYRIVQEHFETFRARAASLREGEGLPRFVEEEFRDFLRCGSLAGGFARFQCGTCGLDRFVAFSCKGRGLCPSCGGRRMTERAAHLVDHVFPDVPVRQWVLSLPYRLRYRLAWDHDLCRAVVAVFVRAVLRCLRAQARDAGVDDGRGGAVAVVQRFGGALNLNIHVHALVLDGVFAQGRANAVAFHPAPPLTTLDVADVRQTVEARVRRLLERRGLGEGDAGGGEGDVWAQEAPGLAGLAAASVQGQVALGRARGARVQRLGDEAEEEGETAHGSCHARANGFDLHAGLVVPAGQRERLERVCRYALRPPVSAERLSLSSAGQVLLRFRQPWRDGTTHLAFDPVEFLGRLAVLVPRPRINLLLYHGVLAPRAAWRSEVVPRLVSAGGGVVCAHEEADTDGSQSAETPDAEGRRARGRLWADLMQRTFGLDVLACSRCGGRLRLTALIEQAAVIQRILRHLGLPDTVPTPSPARAPPLPIRRHANNSRYDPDADEVEAS